MAKCLDLDTENEDPPIEEKIKRLTSLPSITTLWLEVLIRECLENDEPRLAWEIIKAEGRHTHANRRCAEKAGLACIRGLGVALDGVGFVARQNRERTGWRIRFTMALQHWLP